MRHFKAGSTASWKKYNGEVITFDAPHTHTIHMKVIGNADFSVYADDVLIACGNNETVQVSLTISELTAITIQHKANKDVFVWVPEAQGEVTRVFPDENFVSLEPRKTISPEIYQMELKMRQNHNMMMNMLADERRARAAAEAAKAPVEPDEPVIEDETSE